MVRLINYLLNHHRIAHMVVFLLFVSGIYTAFTIQREELPAIDLDIMQITTEYPGAAPEDVELNVTNKIEDELVHLANIKKIDSYSMENRSIITIEIDSESADREKTKQDIRDAVNRIKDLPTAVTTRPLIEEIKTVYPMYEIALSGNCSEGLLRTYARDFETAINEINGIAAIEKIGYRKQIVSINADISKVKKEQISFQDIAGAIQNHNIHSSGGIVQSFTSEKKIVTLAKFKNINDVKNVIVRSNYEGFNTTLNAIAEVRPSYEDHTVKFRGNGKSAIGFLITKQEKADAIIISDTLSETLKKFKTRLPDHVSIEKIYDFSLLTRTMLDIVTYNALIGFILVIVTMFFFLDIHSAFWSAFGIPFSILSAIAVFPVFGINLNTVTLGSLILVIGIIVDDAIVITEKIFSLKQQGYDPGAAAVMGVSTMVKPVSASIITTILAFLPVLFVPGIMGRFMKGIPIVITIILLFSLVESLLFVPVHTHNVKPLQNEPLQTRWFKPVRKWYYKTITKALKKRNRVVAAFLLILIVLLVISSNCLSFMLEQDSNPDHYMIKIKAVPGTPLATTEQITIEIEKLIKKTVHPKYLQSFSSLIGSNEDNSNYTGNDIQNSNLAVIRIYLLPAARRDISSEKIISQLQSPLDKVKRKWKLEQLSLIPLGFSSGKAIEITSISNNNKNRILLEQRIISYLQSLPEVKNIESSRIMGKKEYRVNFNYYRMAQIGINTPDVAQIIKTAFDGAPVTSVRKNGENIEYRLYVKNRKNYTKNDILQLPVPNKQGRLVPLKHFAFLKTRQDVLSYNHYNGKRSITISADIDKNTTTSQTVNSLIVRKFQQFVNRTPELEMHIGGQQAETDISMKGFYFALFIALISIYFILVVLFNSFLQPVLIMSIIPFTIAGVFITLLIHNEPLVMISLVGLLGLIGVVVNDTIVMISNLNKKSNEQGNKLRPIAHIAEGAAERLRPVLLTTLTTFAGLIPTAYGIGGDLPLIRPLVLTMAWGLLFSTVITLIWIPVLFSFTGTNSKNDK